MFLPRYGTIMQSYRIVFCQTVIHHTAYIIFYMKIPRHFVLGSSADSPLVRLEPHVLDAVAITAASDLIRAGESQNTVNSYKTALRYWAGWFALRYGRALTLPLEAATVVQFIVDHAQRQTKDGLISELPAIIDQALVRQKLKAKPGPLALSTVLHRVSVLSKAHRLRRLPN